MNALYGKKIGMTKVFTENGAFVPVTVLEMTPNVVYQVKKSETEGYNSIQVGIGSQKAQRVNKPSKGHYGAAKKGFPTFVGEIRLDRYFDGKEFQVGDEISIEGLFEVGSNVDVRGRTIGKGFAGVVKRHGMKGAQTVSHGTHEYFRHGGSIGCRKSPGRVWKNKRMPGRMGNAQRFQEGLEVVAVRPEDNLLLVKGSVPGPKNAEVFVRSSLKCH